MPAERFFFNGPLNNEPIITLKEGEFHHLAHVMKLVSNDELELVNGRGILAKGVILSIKKEKAEIKIISFQQEEPKPPHLFLFQAYCKQNKLDFILEKGTELGVNVFYFFPGERSGKKEWFPSQSERAHALTVAAMKQSGRLFLPEVKLMPKITEWSSIPPLAFFGDLDPEAQLFTKEWEQRTGASSAAFITGPESGFSDKETESLKQLGAIGVKLHSNILRAETASIVALSLLSHWME